MNLKSMKAIRDLITGAKGFRRLRFYIEIIENGQPYAVQLLNCLLEELERKGIDQVEAKEIIIDIISEFGDYAMRVSDEDVRYDLRKENRAFELGLFANIVVCKVFDQVKDIEESKEEVIEKIMPDQAYNMMKLHGLRQKITGDHHSTWEAA